MTRRLVQPERLVLWTLLLASCIGATVIAQSPTAQAAAADTAKDEAAAAQMEPRRVLLLYSYDREFAPHLSFIDQFRPELTKRWTGPIEFTEVSLQSVRATVKDPDDSLLDGVKAVLGGRRFDLVVPIGDSAARFALKLRWRRSDPFRGSRMLLAAVDDRFVKITRHIPMTTAVSIDYQPERLIQNILNLMPETQQVMVVAGASSVDRTWVREMKKAVTRFEDRLKFTWTDEMAFSDVLNASGKLPERSAILYAMLSLDANGVPHIEDDVLDKLHQATAAPIFGIRSSQLGKGIVGGPLLDVEELSSTATASAVRLLRKDRALDVGAKILKLGDPVYDGKELDRWNIPEKSLPEGSVVKLREPSIWDKYRKSIVAVAAVAGVQAVLVLGLAASVARRRRTEKTLRESEGRFRTLSNSLSGLSRRLMETHEQEQARVTKELQDDLSQRMMGLTMQLHMVSRTPATSVVEMRSQVGDLSGQFARLASEIFALSDKLYGSNVTVLGLVPATRLFCEQLAAQHDVTIDVDDDDVPANLSKDVSLALFRVMQEAVRNAVKYSFARAVTVSLHGCRDEVELEVTDEGAGFDPESVMKSGGVGLIGMRERLSLVDGQCAIESRPGAGTRVYARVPLTKAA